MALCSKTRGRFQEKHLFPTLVFRIDYNGPMMIINPLYNQNLQLAEHATKEFKITKLAIYPKLKIHTVKTCLVHCYLQQDLWQRSNETIITSTNKFQTIHTIEYMYLLHRSQPSIAIRTNLKIINSECHQKVHLFYSIYRV